MVTEMVSVARAAWSASRRCAPRSRSSSPRTRVISCSISSTSDSLPSGWRARSRRRSSVTSRLRMATSRSKNSRVTSLSSTWLASIAACPPSQSMKGEVAAGGRRSTVVAWRCCASPLTSSRAIVPPTWAARARMAATSPVTSLVMAVTSPEIVRISAVAPAAAAASEPEGGGSAAERPADGDRTAAPSVPQPSKHNDDSDDRIRVWRRRASRMPEERAADLDLTPGPFAAGPCPTGGISAP